MKSKKAEERILSIWLFIVWAIIGFSVVIGVMLFLSVQADARGAEASILADRLSDCLSENFDYLEISNPNFDIYSYCGFNQETLEDYDYFYFKITIKDGSKTSYSRFWGDGTFQVRCDYQKEGEIQKNFPQCSYKSIKVGDKSTGKEQTLDVLAASNQRET